MHGREHLAPTATRCERLLDDVTENRLEGDAYEQALTPLVGSGFQCRGGTVPCHLSQSGVSRWRAQGLALRQLLAEYDRAKVKTLHGFDGSSSRASPTWATIGLFPTTTDVRHRRNAADT